jgi:hypothetical protein
MQASISVLVAAAGSATPPVSNVRSRPAASG